MEKAKSPSPPPYGRRFVPLSHRAKEGVPAGALLALGCFDGLHKGHVSLIERAVAFAKEHDMMAGVWSPRGAKNTATLLPFEDKMEILSKLSLDFYLEEEFETIKDLSGKAFFEQYLVGKYGVGALACGENFTFGKGGKEGALELSRYGKERNIPVLIEEMQKLGDSFYSSALVRKALSEGLPERAAELLCRPYGFSAMVVKGRQVGRNLGFPTANLTLPPKAPLKLGVYFASVAVDEKPIPAIANVGIHPTFEEASVPLCEAYLLKDPQTELYGKWVKIEFLKYQRPEQRFSSPQELVAQIDLDLAAAKRFFEGV